MTERHRAEITKHCRFTVAQDEFLRQFETVFRRPIRDGYDAVPVGNGDLAAVLWQPDHLTLMLNKCDISMDASQAEPGVVYAITPHGTRLEDVPMVQITPRTDGSPTRLGMTWYGQREGANCHTATFPLW